MLRLTSIRAEPLLGRIDELQVLRAVAVLLVVLWHSITIWKPSYELIPIPFRFGYAGVDLFFAISGFIMMHVTAGDRFKPGAFAKKRLVRILPMYWIATTLVLAVWLLRPELVPMRGDENPMAYLVASYALAPLTERPLLGVGWSLTHEFIFYAIVGLMMLVGRRALILPALLSLFAIGVVLHVGAFYLWREIWDFKLFSLYHIEFAAGVAAYQVLATRHVLRPRLLLALGGALFVLTGWLSALMLRDIPYGEAGSLGHVIPTGADGLLRCVGFAAASFLIIVGLLNLKLRGRLMMLVVILGNASYTIYLFHNLMLQAAAKVVGRFIHSMPIFVIVAICVAAAVCAGGVVLYRLVEKPVTRAVEQLVARREAAPRPAAW